MIQSYHMQELEADDDPGCLIINEEAHRDVPLGEKCVCWHCPVLVGFVSVNISKHTSGCLAFSLRHHLVAR